MKLEKVPFVLPVTTSPISRDRDWIFKGTVFRWLGIWKGGRLYTLTDRLIFHFNMTLFIRRRKVWVRGLEFKKKVNQIKSCSILSSVDRWFFICVLSGGHLTLEHKGSDTILKACSPLGHKGGTACGLLEPGWLIPSVSEIIAFYMH